MGGSSGGRKRGVRRAELGTYVRSEDRFISCRVDLGRPELAGVRRALKSGDRGLGWRRLLAHFARRRRPRDPQLLSWPAITPAQLRKAVARSRRKLDSWRVDGRVDWNHDNDPPRERWEEYWSRGRLGPLHSWSAAAEASGRADLCRAVADLFLEWYRDCPVPELPHREYWHRQTHGFSWREIEVAIRGRFLITLFLAAARWPRVPQEFLRKLLLSVGQHLDYLATYYSAFGFIEGNHQNHHAAAPLAAGVLLPELKGSRRLRNLGLRIYREHLAGDFDRDFVQNEYSPAYHQNMFTIYLSAYELLRANRQPVPRWLERSLHGMAEFLLYSTGPDGWKIPINDSRPSASGPGLDHAARVLKRPDLLVAGRSGRRGRALRPSRAYLPAGLALMRSDWTAEATFVVLDATKHNSGHWHAGKPNLLIHCGRQPLACEHMFANYDHPSLWRYFHDARAHNTVLVDGQGDAVPESAWEYRHLSRPALDFFSGGRGADLARASTDGFRRMKSPVGFCRTVVFVKPDLILVHDLLRSGGEHCYEWMLHFLPGRLLARESERSLTTDFGGGAELLCRPLDAAGPELVGPLVRAGMIRNSTEGVPVAGRKYWSPPPSGQSPKLLAEAPYAVWSRIGGTVSFDFLLQVMHPGDRPVPVEPLATSARSGVAAWRLQGRDGPVTVLFDDRRSSGRGELRAGGLVLSGRVGVGLGAGRRAELLSDGKLSARNLGAR
jgi:hypothetical protein